MALFCEGKRVFDIARGIKHFIVCRQCNAVSPVKRLIQRSLYFFCASVTLDDI